MQNKDFQYYHERVSFLIEMYDSNWRSKRELIIKNVPKISKIIKEYRKFGEHNPILAFNLERKVQAELNYIPKK